MNDYLIPHCMDLVTSYFPMILDMVNSNIVGAEFCERINACVSNSNNVGKYSRVLRQIEKYDNVKHNKTCNLCINVLDAVFVIVSGSRDEVQCDIL